MHTQTPTIPAARGFTLIELLITLVVAALVLGLAAPTFRDFTIRSQLSTSSNDLISAVTYARSEAIRRGLPVSICSSNDGATCSGTWSDGWITFVNLDNDMPVEVDAGEIILKVHEGLPARYTLTPDASLASGITYGTDGAANVTGVVAVCYDDRLEGSRAIVLTRLRPRMARDTDDDGIPNRDDGENIKSCATPGA